MPARYSSPFHARVFLFTKNEKPLAVGSGSTDLISLVSPVNQHLYCGKIVGTLYNIYVFTFIQNILKRILM